MRTPLRLVSVVGLSVLLAACSQSSVTTDPYASGAAHPWSYTAPPGKVSALSLTPGVNTLYYEPVLAAKNGWGPIEIDHSNGEQGAGDGRTLTVGGQTFARGFGAHANSEMRYALKGANGAACTRFTADVGVDDEVGPRGSVVFQVYLDGVKAFDSGVMTGADSARPVDVDISGRSELRLVVTDAGNGLSYDHADWLNPRITCMGAPVTMTPAQDQVAIYHLHAGVMPVLFSSGAGGDHGPLNLRLEVDGTPVPAPVIQPHLLTTQVSFAGQGPVRKDISISMPDIPSLQEYTQVGSAAAYRLVASVNGRDVASAVFRVQELPLTITTRFEPSTVTAAPGETKTVTLVATVSPPLDAPASLSLMGATSAEDEFTRIVSVGAPRGDGGTSSADVQIQFTTSPNGDMAGTFDYYVDVAGISGYRHPFYGNHGASLTRTIP